MLTKSKNNGAGIPGEKQLEAVSDKFVQLLGKCLWVTDQWYGVSSAVRFGWNTAVSDIYGPGLWFVRAKDYELEKHAHFGDLADAWKAALEYVNSYSDASVSLQRIDLSGEVVETVGFELSTVEYGRGYSEDEYEALAVMGGPVVQIVNQIMAVGFPTRHYDDDDDYQLIPNPPLDWIGCQWKIVGITSVLDSEPTIFRICPDDSPAQQ